MVSFLKKIIRWRNIVGAISVLSCISLLLSYLSPFIHPNTIKIIPLFGLAYPFILLSNILLFIFWLIVKSKWSWIIGIIIIIGGKLHFRVFSFGAGDKNEEAIELSIMSYNVRLFDRYDSDRTKSYTTKDKIFNFLRKNSTDVICFQEFYQQDIPTNFVTKDSLIPLLNTFDYHERYAHRMAGRQNFGVAIYSKLPIIEKGTINFNSQSSQFNFCIYSDIVKEQDTFRVYNVHLQSIRFGKEDYALFEESTLPVKDKQHRILQLLSKVTKAYPVRAEQTQLVLEHIKKSPFPVIVCGDFNDTPMSYTYNRFYSSMVDAYKNTTTGIGATYIGKIPIGRIDYIFHSSELGSNKFAIQQEELSDHRAIQCHVFKKI